MNGILMLGLLVGFPVLCFGYTDPGTGVFLLQSLIAGSLGVIYSFRKALYRLFHRAAEQPLEKADQTSMELARATEPRRPVDSRVPPYSGGPAGPVQASEQQ
jgi:hypothetical protein